MKKVIFIMGAGHCGSTLLDLILGSHSEGFSLAEFRVIPRLLDEKSRNPSEKICVICKDQCDFWEHKISSSQLELFYSGNNIFQKIKRKLVRQFKNPYDLLFDASGKSIMIDSSKAPHWFESQLSPRHTWKKTIPYLIYLKRDGRAVVNSYLRKYPERGLEKIANRWVKNIVEMNAYYESFPFENRVTMHYEELAKYPERTMKKLCESLGISFEKQMLLYWSGDHHPIAGNGGTQSLILKFRETASEVSSEYRTNINEGDKYYQKKYYDDVGLAIRFDERWKRELSDTQLEEFDAIAGELNKRFIFSD